MAGSGLPQVVDVPVRKPVGALTIHLLWRAPERMMHLARLEALHFLLDWKVTQETGTPFTNLRWQHDGRRLCSPELLARLRKDIQILIEPSPQGPLDWLVRPNVRVEAGLPAGLLERISPFLAFLSGRATEALHAIGIETFPARTMMAGHGFMLDERLLAYRRSKRIGLGE